MVDFTTTRLWEISLAPQTGDQGQGGPRELLRSAFLKFRERASVIAGEIARDLPEFTVHDVSHLDALWQMADLIAGEDIDITPAEAFVLGGAFLIHDLGMGLAAYPGGRASLYEDPSWDDLVVIALKRKLGRHPTGEERRRADAEIELEAVTELLRQRHASQADKLATISWQSRDGKETYHLIEDPELRRAFGRVIGQLAYSHWWPVDEVRQKFADLVHLRPPAGMNFPLDWTVDHLKLAGLLRTSDAIHLDSRRAPGFLRALRKPVGYADLHWKFQQNIHTPGIEGERIVFTSGDTFTADDAEAWWVGYELLQNADRELRQVDALLQDLNRPYRFAARGVAGVEEPARLKRLIPTQGWIPVDVRVRVSNVAALVRNLGGEQLYGRDLSVPLRELIQNASDAVRARKLLKNLPDDWGGVVVRLGNDESGHWIEVEDTGVGMSQAVLAGPFLDFGKSFWETPMAREAYPGLQARGFQSTGKYGIGFFSTFMLGDKVRITTQHIKGAQQDTKVLEFSSGLESRPILRDALESEYLRDFGTCVRVWLKEPPDSSQGILSTYLAGRSKWSLEDLCAWLCPALDVNLYVEQDGSGPIKVVSASDWKSMGGAELFKRMWLNIYQDLEKRDNFTWYSKVAGNFTALREPSGREIGRACIAHFGLGTRESTGVIVTNGGLRNGDVSGIAGLLFGNPLTAARDSAIPIVEAEELARWASEQSSLVGKLYHDPEDLSRCAALIRACGGDTGGLPIAFYKDGWINIKQVAAISGLPDEILLVSEVATEKQIFGVMPEEDDVLNSGVMSVQRYSYRPGIRENHSPGNISWPPSTIAYDNGEVRLEYESLKVGVIEALAQAWSSSLDAVLKVSTFSARVGDFIAEVGKRGDEALYARVDYIRNPRSRSAK